MGRMSKKDMEELREFCSTGCDYSGTKEHVSNIVAEILEELGSDTLSADECIIQDLGCNALDLEEFVSMFWDKAVESVLNAVETQGK